MKNRKVLLILKKLVSSCLILTMLIYVLMNIIYENKTHAITQTRENYTQEKIKKYSGYEERIENLKRTHPNWNFTILYTNLDWNQVIKNETIAWHGRNLVPSNSPSSWICTECGDKSYDNGSWRCASEAIVSYYMDPRNSLNEDYIFQFEQLSFNEQIQTIEGVKQIVKDVKYMQGENITYTKTDGTQGVINKSYAQVIMEAAKEAKISPYHLATRIRQEQGLGEKPSALANGTYDGYIGYYNFLNIKASGNGTVAIITNGLNYAKENQLTDPEISIKQGARVISKNYIAVGQDTLYLQKFDVDNSDGGLYYFQYMQNLSASKTEGAEVKNSYNKLGLLNQNISFVIPVYENMPETPCIQPGTENIVTQDVKVKGTEISVRKEANTNSEKIAIVGSKDILLRIEMASQTGDGGYYWDKVVLPNGVKGYIARNYIEEIADNTNTNDTMFATTAVYLRNGPGLTGTTTITTLSSGQQVTRIETGKYNGLDGYDWDRVILSDGRKGYVASKYLEKTSNEGGNNNTQEPKPELVKVICPSGLKVREQPGTDKRILTYLDKGDIITRTKANASQANGYIWDKITTNNGVEGYIARGDSSGDYIEVVEQEIPSNPEQPNNPGNSEGPNNPSIGEPQIGGIKLEKDKLICEPNASVEMLKEKYEGKEIIVNKSDGTRLDTGKIGTGCKVVIQNTIYTVVKKGDVSGDGEIDARDSLRILKYSVGTYELQGEYKEAADVSGDGEIDARDSLRILKYNVGTFNIEI